MTQKIILVRCIDEYDKYQGMRELMPYAKAVSAKSYDFDSNGEESTIDFKKINDILQKNLITTATYGIEYEGLVTGEYDGINKTKSLLERYL